MISLLLLAYAAVKPFPRPTTLEQRLAAFPRDGLPLADEVSIYWNEHQVPFIDCRADADLPRALGLVHAHLRLSQLELLRRIARGRVAEMGGQMFAPVDRAIRTLELDRAVPEIARSLPSDTREWLDGYVQGINAYLLGVEDLPFEYGVSGVGRTPWTIEDVLSIGRLIAIDVNWLDWFPMLKLRDHPDWKKLWSRLVAHGDTSLPSFRVGRKYRVLNRILAYFTRTGSNSFTVAGRRSDTGAPLIANDPHVGLMLPNLWLLLGYQAPSDHAVGLMFPGLPLIALGRNQRIAWGGTNMHAASSDLYSVSGLDPSQVRAREERVTVRGWFDRRYTMRDSDLGPIISDVPILGARKGEDFALRWIGHEPSDEFTALLRVSRARSWDDFRTAFDRYAVSGMNVLYADVDGNIGQVLAVRLPVRKNARPSDLILDGSDAAWAWDGYLETADLPYSYNPPEGFLVSANNRPVEHDVPISFFFSTNDRIHRISELLDLHSKISIEDLKRIQTDVRMPSAVELRDVLVATLDECGLNTPDDHDTRELIMLLRSWNGAYRVASKGALAFELFVHHLSKQYYGPTFGAIKTATYASVGRIKPLLEEDLSLEPPDVVRQRLTEALSSAAHGLKKFENWGAMHRYGLSHPMNALPLLGRRYRFLDHPAPGSSDTVFKTAHGSTDRRHRVGYGASARHISDLSDLDNNWFVLFGGQDGWFNSSTFMDQVPLWLEGAYFQMPMRLETVQRTFAHKTVLKPAAAKADDAVNED